MSQKRARKNRIKNRLFFLVQGVVKYWPFFRFRSFVYRFFLKKAGKNLIVQDGVTIKYPDQIEIGSHVTINQGCFLVGLSGLKIGDHVRIGAGCKIVTSTHNFEKTDEPICRQGLSAKPIVIQDDVWFGFDSVVLGGSRIGKGCIVGAMSLIKGSFDGYSIIAGIPAKVIRKRKKTSHRP